MKASFFFYCLLALTFSLEARNENQKLNENNAPEEKFLADLSQKNSSLSIEPLFSDFVAEVKGIDLRQNLSPSDISKLKKSLSRFCVLVFKNQTIDHAHLVRLAKVFGVPSNCGDVTNLNDHDEILDLSSFESRQKKGNALWHIDMPILDSPPLAAILYAVEIPEKGGETQFVDLSRSFQNLPTVWKDCLKDKYAIHDLEIVRERIGILDPNELKSNYKPNRHPVVCIDPFSGKKCLMISVHTRLIEGLELTPGQDQDSMLSELFDYAVIEPYTHEWQIHDVVLWNNRRCLHRVLPYSEQERRRLKRVEIIGGQRPTNANSFLLSNTYGQHSPLQRAFLEVAP